MALGATIALIAAACGGSDSDNETVSSQDQQASTDVEGSAETTSQPPADAPTLAAVAADGWTATAIAEGTKPVLAIAPDDTPGVAFLFEDVPEGFVAYANRSNGWEVERFVEGYFYGPIGLDYDPSGRPNIAYHDHQAADFDQELGDLTYAVLDGADWTIEAAASDGHDGWDSTIRVDDDGVVRAAGVDPLQFGRVEGLEYYELVDGEWQVEAIGSGPIEYEWNVDLQVAPDGTPALTYFLTDVQDLIFSSRASDGSWTAETIDADGDAGRFSSLAFDDAGGAHVTYWHGDSGEVRYASNATGGWEIETIDTLASVEIGFEGARRITALAIDPTGSPVVAYSDLTGIWLATRSADGSWSSEQIVTAGDRPLGQLVSMELDTAGTPHLGFFEVTANGPLAGVVAYLAPTG